MEYHHPLFCINSKYYTTTMTWYTWKNQVCWFYNLCHKCMEIHLPSKNRNDFMAGLKWRPLHKNLPGEEARSKPSGGQVSFLWAAFRNCIPHPLALPSGLETMEQNCSLERFELGNAVWPWRPSMLMAGSFAGQPL